MEKESTKNSNKMLANKIMENIKNMISRSKLF